MEDSGSASWLGNTLKKLRRSPRRKKSDQPPEPVFSEQPQAPPLYNWRVIGKSIRGASHLRSGLPNQDAIGWTPESGIGSELMIAVSDGHGSAKYFRSDVGAAFAVQAALAEGQNLISGQPDANLSAIKRTAEEHLPQAIVRHWQRLVQDHVANNPISPDELDQAIAKSTSPVDRSTLEANPHICYGATLVSAVVTNSFAVFLQLGDGDILTVFEGEEVSRPIAHLAGEESIGDDTRSFCLPNAWRDFAFGFQALSGSAPALILVTTDGYPKSFTDDAGFLKLGSDIFELIHTQGLDAVAGNMESWLNEASNSGSGDDISLGLVYRGEESTAAENVQTQAEEQT